MPLESCCTMSWLLTVVVVAGSLAGMTSAFPQGAPLTACSSLTPKHDSNSIANTAFSIQTEPLAANQLRVTLSSTTVPFKGFIMAARDPSGQFTPEDTTAQLLDCKNQPTVTHTSGAAKFSVSVLWQRDPKLEPVTFVATVVTSFNEGYVPDITHSYTP